MTSPILSLDRDALLRLEDSLTQEWLETDGLGGAASSTVLLCPTRRYHALLMTPRPGTAKRHVWLSRYDDALVVGGRELPLSMARYRGVWAPHGHQALESFELAPFPRWTWLWGGVRVEREVLVPAGEACVLVRWRVSGAGEPVKLRLRPLLPFREADALTVENMALDARVERFEVAGGGIACQPYGELPRISIAVSQPFEFTSEAVWYRGLEYTSDLQRGYPGHEDQFSPGAFEIVLADGADVVVQANLGAPLADPLARFERESRRRRAAAERALARSKPAQGELFQSAAAGRGDAATAPLGVRAALELSADAFLYRTETGRRGVIAGWPWFLEWGRDTYISLPGLLAARGRNAELGDALAGAIDFLRDGLLPNVFGATPAESHYGSVDASLWFARAVRLHEKAGAPTREIAARFLPALLEIATCYRDGTGLGIRGDEDGLLVAGSPKLNATWMDARIEGVPVTPRHGAPVEIEALWYFLLAYVEDLLLHVGRTQDARAWRTHKERAALAFLDRFWMASEERLADVWRVDEVERALRPNQVIAAALEWSPLSRAQRGLVAKSAAEVLLVPRGLRTLDPRDRAYVGRYAGNEHERDRAYHQGTAWPWLVGSFVEAWLRGVGDDANDRAFLRGVLDSFAPHLQEAGLMHVSEVFDGDAPHTPGGCFAQAWSTAEILRAYALLDR
ncbi:MAG: glycogen debranching enzyme N-terminal domain-containing protein [Planctomycetota bacterium]|nr:glycogen debranching enzyme N-terminal domain-containing protein [Planctomycetota bacterium]